MHTRSPLLSLTISLLLCCPIIALGQGLVWESTTTIRMGGEHTIDSKSYYLPGMFKQGSAKEATVFRLDKQMMYTIDYGRKEYSEMKFEEFEATVKKANSEMEGHMAELKKQLAEMPEEQRKAMEKMMGAQLGAGGGEATIEVTKSPESKTISGFACSNYVLTQGGKEIGNFWTTTNVPDFSAMQKDLREFSRRLASQMTMGGPGMAEAMTKVEGFPIQTTIGGMTVIVHSVGKASVAQGDFEVPAGFKKVPFAAPGEEQRKGRMAPQDQKN